MSPMRHAPASTEMSLTAVANLRPHVKMQLYFRFRKKSRPYGPFSNRFYPSTRTRCIVLKTLRSRIAHVQHMRIESPRKTCHHSKERRSVASCLQFRITNLALSKYQKLVKTRTKLKEKLKPIHRFRKVPFSGVHTNTLRYSSENIHPGERLRKVACSVIVFIVYVWMIAVSVTKELRFRSVWTGSVPVTDSHPLYTICAGAVSLGGGGLPYSLGVGVPLGSRKSYPFTRTNFANFVTIYQTKNAQLFLISVFSERSR